MGSEMCIRDSPRISTLIIALVGILLMFAGIQSRINRRRWTSHLAYLESLGADGDDDSEDQEGDSIPAPVIATEEEESDDYEDDEIELV